MSHTFIKNKGDDTRVIGMSNEFVFSFDFPKLDHEYLRLAMLASPDKDSAKDPLPIIVETAV